MDNSRYKCLTLTLMLIGSSVVAKPTSVTYVSLSYDDALVSQLDYAVPALDEYQLKASFYLVPANAGFIRHKARWQTLTNQGHELGNHSYSHPCRGSLPDREWVEKSNDLDTLSVDDMVDQVSRTNAILHDLDGATRRTYTIPCGDRLASGSDYLPAVSHLLYAVKGAELEQGKEVIVAPSDISGAELIDMLNAQPDGVRIINIIFHGIGGDYLSVSDEAHRTLLAYLDAHRSRYEVDTYRSIIEKVRANVEDK